MRLGAQEELIPAAVKGKPRKLNIKQLSIRKAKSLQKDLTSGRFSVDLAAKRLLATAKGEIAILQRENAITAMG